MIARTFFLTKEMITEIAKVADKLKMSLSDLVRQAIGEFIERNK